jgi:putative tricarboxylic transport membrane protein
MSGAPQGGAGTVGARGPELAVAALLAAIGTIVVVDSLRVGIGWADDGPRSGYFPFYIGLLLLASSVTVLVSQLLRWRTDRAVFAGRSQLKSVFAVLLPMSVYIALIKPAGIYVASALLIGWFMRRHGKHGLALTAGVSIGVPLLIFAVFERWFLVPLPKGPIERLLGF